MGFGDINDDLAASRLSFLSSVWKGNLSSWQAAVCKNLELLGDWEKGWLHCLGTPVDQTLLKDFLRTQCLTESLRQPCPANLSTIQVVTERKGGTECPGWMGVSIVGGFMELAPSHLELRVQGGPKALPTTPGLSFHCCRVR